MPLNKPTKKRVGKVNKSWIKTFQTFYPIEYEVTTLLPLLPGRLWPWVIVSVMITSTE